MVLISNGMSVISCFDIKIDSSWLVILWKFLCFTVSNPPAPNWEFEQNPFGYE